MTAASNASTSELHILLSLDRLAEARSADEQGRCSTADTLRTEAQVHATLAVAYATLAAGAQR